MTDQISLQNWLQDLLGLGSARSDAILLALAFKSESKAELIYLNQLALALSASAERRSETLLQGQAFGKTIRDVWGQDCTDLCYPVALGAAARRENLIKEDIIAAYLHAFSANLISAAIRLVPLGQTQGQHILLALTSEINACAAEASDADEDDLSSTTFLSDVASMRHETLHTRIFKT